VAPKRNRPRPEQLKIAGTERRDRVPELDRLAEEFRDADDQYQAFREEKNGIADKLAEIMTERGLSRYVFEGRDGKLHEVTIEELEAKVKVKQLKAIRPQGVPEPAERN
jgi:uncharacterized protein YydD (DUF2326 family)